jgi:hypothetical protein
LKNSGASVKLSENGLNTLAIRIVLLATLLFALNAWTVRHLGSEITELATLNGFVGFVALVLGWVEQRQSDHWRQKLRNVLRHATDTPVLACLFLLALVGTSFVSSVTVLADGVNGVTTLHLTAEGRSRSADSEETRLEGPSGMVRFVRLTGIFGRRLYLEASGYQRQSLTLMPWTGTTVSLASDLVRLPSVLLRVPPALHSLLAGGKLVIECDGQPGAVEIPLRAQRASVQIGQAAAIPDEWRDEWRSELRTLHEVPDGLRESLFRNWLNPLRSESVPIISPGQKLQIRLLTSAGKEVIRQEVIIGREPLQDIALIARNPVQ